jgi:hypothetical protein
VEPIQYRWDNLPQGFEPDGPCISSTHVQYTSNRTLLTMIITDAVGHTEKSEFSLAVRPGIRPLRIVTNSIPTFILGEPVNYEITATGGEGILHWTVLESDLPEGLQVQLREEGRNCAIVGTPRQARDFREVVSVSDALHQVGPVQLNGSVAPALAPHLAINPGPLPPAFYGVPYAQALVAIGGKPPYTWTVEPKTLPNGRWLGCDARGIIAGTPPGIGTVPLAVSVTDAMGTKATQDNMELRIEPLRLPGPFELQPMDMPTAIVNHEFSAAIFTVNQHGVVSWQTSGLPPWMHIKTNGFSLLLSGQPDRADTWNFTVAAQDYDRLPTNTPAESYSFGATEYRHYTIKAVEEKPSPPPLRFITQDLPAAVVDVSYRVQLAAGGGEGGITFDMKTNLVPWVRVSPSGELSGTPPNVGEGDVVIEAKDLSTKAAVLQKLTLKTVEGAKEKLRVLDLPTLAASRGHSFYFKVPVADGVLPYKAKMESNPPPGLSFDSNKLQIAGVPSQAGAFPLDLVIQDATTNGTPLQHRFDMLVLSDSPSFSPVRIGILFGAVGLVAGIVVASLLRRPSRPRIEAIRPGTGASTRL